MGLLSKIANSGMGKAGAAIMGGGAALIPAYEMLNPPAVYAHEGNKIQASAASTKPSQFIEYLEKTRPRPGDFHSFPGAKTSNYTIQGKIGNESYQLDYNTQRGKVLGILIQIYDGDRRVHLEDTYGAAIRDKSDGIFDAGRLNQVPKTGHATTKSVSAYRGIAQGNQTVHRSDDPKEDITTPLSSQEADLLRGVFQRLYDQIKSNIISKPRKK